MIARMIEVPRDALLQKYVADEGTYTDAFEVMHPLEADLSAFITAFYTTWLFRLERAVLTLSLRKRITDKEVVALAKGAERFAAWTVEERAETQILLCDLASATRSWLAVAPKEGGVTRLLFGSAVVARNGTLPWWVRGTVPLHRFYSRALLRLAERKLRRG